MSAILSQCQRLENKMKELQSEMRELKYETDELKYEMIELISRTSLDKTRIKALENSCFGFRATRNSFISAAKRDIFGTATHEDHVMIAASVRYGIPNFGYAEFDAGLYRNGARKDFAAYERLYGLHPDVVRSIEDRPTLMMLDRHATVVASGKHIMTLRFHHCFADFVAEVKERHCSDRDLNDSGILITRTAAYWELLKCFDEEIREKA